VDLTKSVHRRSREPIEPDCPCPACSEHTRGYLHYLSRANELTAKRLLTLHNLTFMERLMRGLREAIAAGEYAREAGRVLA
jgi:queuine tRNA-ribosyltransferase